MATSGGFFVETAREFLKLGLFMPNCSYLSAISMYRTVPDEWPYSTNKAIALAAEAAGFDMLFPVSRWRGFGGETNYMGISLETTTWAAGLLEATSRIKIFSTVHVPLFHPRGCGQNGCYARSPQWRAVGDQYRQWLERSRV